MKDGIGKFIATGSTVSAGATATVLFDIAFQNSPNVAISPYVLGNVGSVGSVVAINTSGCQIGGVSTSDVYGYVASDANQF